MLTFHCHPAIGIQERGGKSIRVMIERMSLICVPSSPMVRIQMHDFLDGARAVNLRRLTESCEQPSAFAHRQHNYSRDEQLSWLKSPRDELPERIRMNESPERIA